MVPSIDLKYTNINAQIREEQRLILYPLSDRYFSNFLIALNNFYLNRSFVQYVKVLDVLRYLAKR